MKTPHPPHQSPKAFTLLETTIVIMVLLALINIGFFASGKMDEWKLGRAASETLRMVYSAQRMYLADNPTTEVKDLTDEMLIPYLPNLGAEAAKKSTLVDALKTATTVKPITGGSLSFCITDTTSPPYFMQNGIRYDPSGSNTDSLWDVGE
jgi:type II secretory pathway pseudopilin PulG